MSSWRCCQKVHLVDNYVHGNFPEDLRGGRFRLIQYRRDGDHEHCSICMDTICSDVNHTDHHHQAFIIRVSDDGYRWTFWICPTCFERFREDYNLSVR